jgi:hypothetical protein
MATGPPQLLHWIFVTSPLGSPPLKIIAGRTVPKPSLSGLKKRFEPRVTATLEPVRLAGIDCAAVDAASSRTMTTNTVSVFRML